MNSLGKTLWVINGKIKEIDGFDSVVADVVEMAKAERTTKTYWWSATADKTKFCDLDIYDTEQAALQHIFHWAKHSDEFEQCAHNERLLVLGDVSTSIKEALSAMNPHYMSFFGGFSRDKESGSDELSQVIWSFEGRITDKKMFREACDKLVPLTKSESGCMFYAWFCDEEDRFFVLESYLDSDAAMLHMKNSAEHSSLFFGSTEVTSFAICSEISPELSDVVASLNPEIYEFVAGFSR